MKKLRILLNSKIFYFVLIFISVINLIFNIFFIDRKSKYTIDENNFSCIIEKFKIDGDKLKLDLECREKVVGYYYFKTEEEKNYFSKNYNTGDILKLNGELVELSSSSNFNMFDYRKYGKVNQMYYQLNINKYEKIDVSDDFIYLVKEFLNNKINEYENYDYISALVLGDKDYLDSEILDAYQKIGVIHLFSISGTHISLITLLIFYILKNSKYFKYILLFLILIIYCLIVDSASIIRTFLFTLFSSIDKIFKLDLSVDKRIILVVCIMLFINAYYIYDVGFQFSIIISSTLLLLNKRINSKNNYIVKTLYISFVSFLVSFPIIVYNFFEVNLFSILYNVILVPFISFIVFPISLLTLIFPFFDILLSFFIFILEYISIFFASIDTCLIFSRPNICLIIIYYILIIFLFVNNKGYIFLIIVIIFHFNINNILNSTYVLTIDVGQGDSLLINKNNNTILIDTGGKMDFQTDEWKIKSPYSIAKKTIIPILKSFGISKINVLVLTHGDYDHMGEAINLVENFKVEKVIFNCGQFNELEQDLIKVLDKRKIPHYSCIKELNLDNNKLYFLNNKEYGNENDNSSVIYTELNNHKFLFMGDAGVEVEESLIKKYNLKDIDVLKVGHHGSRTSSGKNFIDEVNPKYSIISVGKNNWYGHPNKEVIENLNYSKIYRTDQDGSIMFKIKNNELKIETCSP